MKYLPYMVFCAILSCCPALHSQSALTFSADDAKFLGSCGVTQDDIKVIPNLPSAGQAKILAILSKDGRVCEDLKVFKDCRDYLRKFNPPPTEMPTIPAGYDEGFFTSAELAHVNDVNMGILAKNVIESLNRQGKGLEDLFDDSALTLSADDVKFLDGCGVRQDDINVIPNLPNAGQAKILAILRKDGRECSDIKSFKDSRDYLRKFTPPPTETPTTPAGYDKDFLTKAESAYVER